MWGGEGEREGDGCVRKNGGRMEEGGVVCGGRRKGGWGRSVEGWRNGGMWKEGMNEGRKEGRKEGKKEGRKNKGQ